MRDIEFRDVTLNDIEALVQISRQTFEETNLKTSGTNNLVQYIEESFSQHKLMEEIGNSYSRFYFVTLNKEVIGYLKLNTGNSQTVEMDKNALEIERIYILSEYQGQKVGQFLFNKAMQVAEQKGSSFVWLCVWEKNLSAIRFYKKNGFAAFDNKIFKLGEEYQTDILMKKNIR